MANDRFSVDLGKLRLHVQLIQRTLQLTDVAVHPLSDQHQHILRNGNPELLGLGLQDRNACLKIRLGDVGLQPPSNRLRRRSSNVASALGGRSLLRITCAPLDCR